MQVPKSKLLLFPGLGKSAGDSRRDASNALLHHAHSQSYICGCERFVPDRPTVVTYRGIVYAHQCDHTGQMSVMWYADKFDQAWWQTLSMIGLSTARMRSENLAVAPMEQHHQYSRELHAGDVVTIRSVVVETNEVTILIRQEMTDDESGALVAANTVRGVLLDAVTRRAQTLPADVRQRATLFMSLNGNTSDSTSIR